MKPTATYNVVTDADKQAFRILQKFGKGVKGGLVAFVQNSAGRVAIRLAGQTYPETLQQGQLAIAKDLNKIWRPVGQLINIANGKDPLASAIINRLKTAGDFAGIYRYLRNLGLNIKTAQDIDPQQHKENRNPRTGRAHSRPKQDVLLFNRDRLAAYAALVPERRVGNAAHGWVQASRKVRKRRSADVLTVGGQVNVNRLAPFKDKPAEVVAENGDAVLSGPADNPVVTISNRFPNLGRVMKSRAIASALYGEGEILRKQVHAAAAREAKKLGLKTYAL